jgi:hypothetical protein
MHSLKEDTISEKYTLVLGENERQNTSTSKMERNKLEVKRKRERCSRRREQNRRRRENKTSSVFFFSLFLHEIKKRLSMKQLETLFYVTTNLPHIPDQDGLTKVFLYSHGNSLQ